MAIALVVGLGAATLVVLVVMLVSLSGQAVRLAGAVAEFERAVRPVLEEIRRDADRAGSRMERLSDRAPRRAGRRG